MGPFTFTDLKKQWKHHWLLPEDIHLFWAMLIYVKSWMSFTHTDISLHKSIKPTATKKKCMTTQFRSNSYQTTFGLQWVVVHWSAKMVFLVYFWQGVWRCGDITQMKGKEEVSYLWKKKDGCDLDMLLTSLKWNTMKFSPEPTASGLFVKKKPKLKRKRCAK